MTRPAERGAGHVLVWMCVLIAVNQLGFGAVIPVLPLYAQSFGVSQAAIGGTIAVYGLARVLLSVPTGRVADWLGRRSALAAGGILSAIGNLWCAFAATYPELVAARFVAGAGAGVVMTAGMIVLADISRPANRGRRWRSTKACSCSPSASGRFPAATWRSGSDSTLPSSYNGIASGLVTLVAWFGVAETRGLSTLHGPGQRRPSPRCVTSFASWRATSASCWSA